WLTPGHPSRPGQWWAGTTPHGLFTSRDGGVTWEESTGFSEAWKGWSAVPGRIEEVPEGAITHSVIVDPRDPEHLYVGLSTGGLFESTDEGATWRPLNRGVAADFLPEKNPEFGHDPHCVVIHPDMPDRLWQQNHCGIYRLERPGVEWERIGKNMPKAVGDIGFPIVLHPRDTDTAWVLPMDGTTVWPRTSVGGKPALYVTRDAGRSWRRQDAGLPARAWLTVKRQGLAADAAGATVDEVLFDLDARFPGIRFRVVDEQGRIRPHIRFWVSARPAPDVSAAVGASDEVMIVTALSGG